MLVSYDVNTRSAPFQEDAHSMRCTSQTRTHSRSHSLAHTCTLLLLCTGAELAAVVNEAALFSIRRGGDILNNQDFYNGMDRILQVRISMLMLSFLSCITALILCHLLQHGK